MTKVILTQWFLNRGFQMRQVFEVLEKKKDNAETLKRKELDEKYSEENDNQDSEVISDSSTSSSNSYTPNNESQNYYESSPSHTIQTLPQAGASNLSGFTLIGTLLIGAGALIITKLLKAKKGQ